MDREYRYEMGFLINGKALPDPSSYTGAKSDLDTLGKRDSTGELRRNKVASKYHIKLEWQNIQWSMIKYIGSMFDGADRFRFTYIDPIGGHQTILAYCGDRDWEVSVANQQIPDDWIGTLKVSVIEI